MRFYGSNIGGGVTSIALDRYNSGPEYSLLRDGELG